MSADRVGCWRATMFRGPARYGDNYDLGSDAISSASFVGVRTRDFITPADAT
jgi:hypothetical protein